MAGIAFLGGMVGFPGAGAEDLVLPQVERTLPSGPAGLTVTPKGSLIASLHQYYHGADRVVEIPPSGDVRPFPDTVIGRGGDGAPVTLDAVQGLECDDEGTVWMLDNGRRSEKTAKIVAWNTKDDVLHRVIHLAPPAVIETSYVHDLALDPEEPYAYVTDPAAGKDAALIVVNLDTGLARRVLQGHFSVVPEAIPLFVAGEPFAARLPDGSTVEPQTGANPIAVDKKGRWVYFGPLKGRTLYRISTDDLRNVSLSPVELNSRVLGYSEKPISDSISIDSKGNIYVADLSGNAIGLIDADERKYTTFTLDPRILWPDSLCFGVDGRLYFAASQLHRSAFLNRGRDRTAPPFQIFSIKPLSSGSVGR